MQTKHAKMPSTDLILISAKFRWIPEEFWEDQHMAYVTSHQGPHHSSLTIPPRQSRRKNAPKMRQQRWVLEDSAHERLVACGVLQSREDKITQSLLVGVFSPESLRDQRELCRDAFSLLASSAILRTRCDILRIAHTNPCDEAREDLTTPWGGSPGILWALPPMDRFLMDAAMPAMTAVATGHFTPQQWWATPNGTKDYGDLSYLRKRQERYEAAESSPPRQSRRQGFFSRLFFWN